MPKTKNKSKTKLPPNYPGHEKAYKTLYLGRLIDDEAPNFLRKAMGWSYHAPNAGHDAIQLALGATFRAGQDHLFPYYRDLTTALAAGLTAKEIILNGLSKDEDVASGGRHMSNHFAKPEINIHNVSSCVSNHIQHAAGLGRAIKYYKEDSVAYASFGESSASEGYVFEALNGISKERLPVVTVMQDNGYGISVPKEDQTANEVTADNFKGLDGAKIWNVDGRDVIACFAAMHEATEYAKAGRGVPIVYAMCARIGSHSNSDNHQLYRDEKELKAAKAHDPLPIFRQWLLDEGHLDEAALKALEEEAQNEFNLAREYGENAPKPDPATAQDFVFAEPYEPSQQQSEPRLKGRGDAEGVKYAEALEDTKGKGLTLRQGINAGLRAEFRENPDTFLWGQDIANKEKEGIFLVTKGFQAEFGKERVFNAPIAENFIMGTANGFTRLNDKIRVVVEGAEFADYFWPAMDQYVECAHDYYRTKGQFTPNVLIRLASGGFIGGGLYHSQTIEGSLANIPGVRIVYPTFADDAYGLARTAMKSRGPTLFLEPKALYNDPRTRSQIPEDFHVPFGKARVRREGTDVVVFTYGNALMASLKAAESFERDASASGNSDEEAEGGRRQAAENAPSPGRKAGGISVAVIDLRSLVPLDTETILEWVKKTGRVVVAHEGPEFAGFGGEIAAWIAKHAFEYLDAPVERVGAKFSPVPFALTLEPAILPQADDVVAAINAVAGF
ncbi:MAG: 2-oxoisovalerate dehydrogenase [Planctomycetes bacterium]|nr:2-oxoisovalerate dehydrogenase [Planctomycetota bacterium]